MGINLASFERQMPNSMASQMHMQSMPNSIGSLLFMLPMPSGGTSPPAPAANANAAGQTLRPNGEVATPTNAMKGAPGKPAPNAAAGAQPVAPFAPVQPGQLKSLLGS